MVLRAERRPLPPSARGGGDTWNGLTKAQGDECHLVMKWYSWEAGAWDGEKG